MTVLPRKKSFLNVLIRNLVFFAFIITLIFQSIILNSYEEKNFLLQQKVVNQTVLSQEYYVNRYNQGFKDCSNGCSEIIDLLVENNFCDSKQTYKFLYYNK